MIQIQMKKPNPLPNLENGFGFLRDGDCRLEPRAAALRWIPCAGCWKNSRYTYQHVLWASTTNRKLYHHLSLSFFEKIRLPDIPKDIPRHTPIPIPAMLFKTFIKTTLQSIAAVIPIVTPVIILLLCISFILQKFRFVEPSIPYSSMKEYPYMKNATVLLYTCFARLLRNLSTLHTDLACKV